MNFKRSFFLFCIFFCCSSAFSSQKYALMPNGYDQQPGLFAVGQMQAVDNALCNRFNCPQFRFLQNATLKNAMVSSDHFGHIIRYNSEFMQKTMQSYGSLAAIGVLAHELGHIIDLNQNRFKISRTQREANADRYAGCAFALAGHPMSDLMGLAQSLYAMKPSPGYPTPSQRVKFIHVGYSQCK